ncbi:MAG: signal recognition particle protein Srp54 [Oscillospiraceae bacterium]|nr:signal recognition particle protein Srp54 [Oscillospiraceae bacterium]
MAFEGLSDKLGKVFKSLKSRGKLGEKEVREAMREVKTALLEADVNFKVTKDFVATVTERSIGAKVMESLTPGQQVIDIVREELVRLLGGGIPVAVVADKAEGEFAEGVETATPVPVKTAKKEHLINFSSNPPTVIMMCGLQGAGKTTHCAKLAKYLKSMSRRPLLVACDVYRPAAIEQLKIVGEKAGAKVFEQGQGNPVEIARAGIKFSKDNGYDVVIIDTAGRLHIDENLMKELDEIKTATSPHEIFLVIDSMIGQDAVNTAKSFNEQIEISGVILTKLDGDTRGGAALSVLGVTGKKIKFAGTGEKIDDLEQFRPEGMASRILGMGDVFSLIDKAKIAYDEKEQDKLLENIQKNRFDFNDMYSQYKQIEKMGSISGLIKLMPGFGNKINEDDIDDRVITRAKAIIESMTKLERERPGLIDAKRKRRIAAGSGTSVEQVNLVMKQMEQMQKMMKGFKKFGKGKGKGKRGMPKLPPGMKLPDGFGISESDINNIWE